MIRYEKARKFDGVYTVLSHDGFNTILNCLKSFETLIMQNNGPEHLLQLSNKTQKVITEYAYFDIENEEARIQLGYAELSIITEAILLNVTVSGQSVDYYADITKTDGFKVWKN